MKVPYSWLADWVDIPWKAAELGSRLTMAGFELDGLEPAAPAAGETRQISAKTPPRAKCSTPEVKICGN